MSSSSSAARFYIILVLVTISSTFASPLAECPESAQNQPSILDSAPLIPKPNNDNILPEAPLPPPPAQTAGAPPVQQASSTVTDRVQPLLQPDASVGTASSSTNLNGNGGEGGEQLGEDNQNENMSSNTGLVGAGAIGGGVGAQPLVDNTPFDSGSSTGYGFMGSSSCIAVMILSILV